MTCRVTRLAALRPRLSLRTRTEAVARGASLALLAHLGCASEVYVEPIEADVEPGDTGKLGGLGGGAGSSGEVSSTGGGAGKTSSGSAGRGGSSAGKANGGSQNGGKSAGGNGTDDGGEAGEPTGGGSAGSGGGSAGSGGGSAGGGGGSLNQPAMCDEATATVLGSMNANISVASNVCLKMTVAADQTWVKKITLQPEGGMYPLPFTWSNCGTNSSGAFTANYANQILTPVNLQCPILVKLGGSGAPVNVQWWGG
jgi:hypothetical protein